MIYTYTVLEWVKMLLHRTQSQHYLSTVDSLPTPQFSPTI